MNWKQITISAIMKGMVAAKTTPQKMPRISEGDLETLIPISVEINFYYQKIQKYLIKMFIHERKTQNGEGTRQETKYQYWLLLFGDTIQFLKINLKLNQKMEADINQPKSKAFNIYLRFLQLGFQIAIAYWAIRMIQHPTCKQQFISYASYLNYIILAISFISVIVIRCNDRFPRPYFFVTTILLILLCLGIIALTGIMAIGKESYCASNEVEHRLYVAECITCITISFIILLTKLAWGQRYSNHPGNIAWVVLFLSFAWTPQFNVCMLIIGIVNAFISLSSLLVNLAACSGTSSSTKRVIVIQWIMGLVFMVICELIAVYLIFSMKKVTEYKDQVARNVVTVFLPVNAIDFIFWIIGLRTLTHENGDRIRDALFSGEEKIEHGQKLQYQEGHEIGTINN